MNINDFDMELRKNECVCFVLNTENESFAENPSKKHIYYSALLARYGIIKAEEILYLAKKNKDWSQLL